MEFDRTNFFPIKKNITLEEISNYFKKKIKKKSINIDFLIKDISSLNKFRDESLLFIKKDNLFLNNSQKIALIFEDDKYYEKSDNINSKLLVNNLDEFYINVVDTLFYHEDSIDYVEKYSYIDSSQISPHSIIDDSVRIGRNCVIGPGVRIGKRCIIKNNVVIKNSIISDDVIIGDNTVIGSSGFGFNIKKPGAKYQLPHIGIVFIAENVSIGTSCTIDRGKIDQTYIGPNSMIDNLVHIAHNVIIEEGATIAAQTGISGSVYIGKNLVSGGQSGFAGHISIGDNVVVAAKSGVTKNISSNSIVAGFPATDIKKWKRQIIKQKKDGY